jgi:hypothetical protein
VTTSSIIEEIKAGLDVVEVVSEHVALQKSGRAFKALCPFHSEKTPSFTVFPDSQRWKCFGCGEGGDVLDFVMRREGWDLHTAMEELARRAGVELRPLTAEQQAAIQEQRTYEEALGVAADHFARRLLEIPRALAYARGRWPGDDFGDGRLGYTDGSPLPALGNERARRAVEHLNKQAGQVGGGVVYVHKEQGRVVYLSFRSIEGKEHRNLVEEWAGPKQPYFNEHYSAKAQEVIVVEGQACARTLDGWEMGGLALAGSDLTPGLAARLERHVERGGIIYLVPDDHGTRTGEIVGRAGPLLRVVALPGAADVNAYAQGGAGADDFRALLDAAPTWLTLEIQRVAGVEEKERAGARRALFEHLAALDPFTLADYREAAKRELEISAEQFNRYLRAVQVEEETAGRRDHDGERYVVEGGRLCVVRYGKGGERYTEPLCNFTAEVVEDVAHDDGQEITRKFTIAGRLDDGRPLEAVEVDTSKFTAMGWVSDVWGVRAVVRAGWRTKDQLREAIQLRSERTSSRYVYKHTGWREIEGRRAYLHAGGAVGVDSAAVEVELDRELERYRLPCQAQDVREAMRASLRFLEIAPETTSVPLWAAVYLAPLSELVYPAFVLWLYGVTGTLKSTMAALVLSHYGAFSDKDLFLWTDTANRLEKTCFLAKDTLLVIDDFAPVTDPFKAREMERNAARIVRNVGNRGGRGRLASDLSLRVVYRPRGLVISTGEQVPDGQSVTARMYTIEVRPGDVDLERLTAAQAEADRYPHALSGYLLWLARQWEHLAETLPEVRLAQRTRLLEEMGGSHLRIPDVLATLWLGLDLGLVYAAEVEALTEAEAQEWRERGWAALKAGAEAQAQRIEWERPSIRFLDVVGELLAQGKVWLRAQYGEERIGGDAVGAELLGWYDDDCIYLLPGVSYNRVARFARDEGSHFPIKERTLWKHLTDEGYLWRMNGNRYTDRFWDGERRHRVLRLSRARIGERVEALACSRTDETGQEELPF